MTRADALPYKCIGLIILLASPVTMYGSVISEGFILKEVLVGPLRERFRPFLDTILMQIPSKDFFTMIDGHYSTILSARELHYYLSDEEWNQRYFSDRMLYEYMLVSAPAFKTFFSRYTPLYKLYALQRQRRVLSDQIKQLIAPQSCAQIATCVEIGKPGTSIASIRDYLPHVKRIICVNATEKVTDRLEGFSMRSPLTPYHQFILLNDYEPITAIDQDSVDLIVCTIGLHHVPVEKLDNFIASIRSLLKPGGIFILRDHNVTDIDVLKVVHAAHSVYNAILAAESVENELKEYRNFQPLSYWIALLQKHGFIVGEERIIQEGDPSMNTLIKATAHPRDREEYEMMIANQLDHDPRHKRDIIQTYLTTPEWLSVDISQEYSNFINHTPFYEFPWIDTIRSYWKAFSECCKVAIKKRGIMPVITSPYMLMNTFIGSTLTIEHILKAIISAPIRYMYSGTEAETLQALVYDPCNELASLGTNITVITSYDNHLKVVEIPRYMLFLKTILALPSITSLEFRTIGGQKEIMCKVRSMTKAYQDTGTHIPGVMVNFEWTLPTQPDYTYAGLTVPVQCLKQFVQYMHTQGTQILYIHDF